MLGEALRALRQERGMSQGQLARRARISGAMMSRIEGGEVLSPGLDAVVRLCRALDVGVETLLFRAGVQTQRPLSRRDLEVKRSREIERELARAERYALKARQSLTRAVKLAKERRFVPESEIEV